MTQLPTSVRPALLALLLLVGACTSGPKVLEFAPTANSSDEVQRFTSDVASARERQVDVLAPKSFEMADRALQAAIRDQSNGDRPKDVLHQVAVGRAQLERANRFAALGNTNLEGVVAARQAAITAGAPKSFKAEFDQADSHLRSVTRDIEDNDLDGVAKQRAPLQAEYLAVELQAIRLTALGRARDTITTAVNEGAKDYAQQSLAIAEQRYSDADAYIVANRHQRDAVQQRSNDANRAADHLLTITRAARSGKNATPEQTALMMESERLKTQAGRDQLDTARVAAAGAAAETRDLKSEQSFNRSFEEARSQFSGQEAQVFRQGDRLVIRLKQLEFPVNQSVLKGGDFAVLSKVARVVRNFDAPTVVVEGHTDSDGGRALNAALSTARAQAVSKYLVSNDAISADRISTVGRGFDAPLASNKTRQGKAQNRRVDVIINANANAGATVSPAVAGQKE